MAFQLSEIVPWGRSFDEYTAMFALSEDDLQKKILGCADGPASFNCELSKRGGTVVSADPIYAYPAQKIRQRIEETFEEVIAQTRQNSSEFVWRHIRSVDELGRVRMEAMREFLADYEQGKKEGRYVAGSLPTLPFSDRHFDLALCSHYLFLYSKQLNLEFHIDCIHELCRVAAEVRIFPLLELGAVPSPHVPPVIVHFKNAGYEADVVQVPYEFQRGGNEMLRVRKP